MSFKLPRITIGTQNITIMGYSIDYKIAKQVAKKSIVEQVKKKVGITK